MNQVLISVPPGWTRTDGPGEIVLEGKLPDTDVQRNAFMRIILKTEPVGPGRHYAYGTFHGTGLAWRGGSLHLKREIREQAWVAGKPGQQGKYVDTGKWRKAGTGGPRLVTTLLWSLAHCGGRW